METPLRYDCLIVGGGPAGAALAWMLAGDGVRVVLVDAGGRAGGAPHETLLTSARPVLERIGLAGLIAQATRVDDHRHGAIWGSEELLWRDDPEPGLLLERGRFEAALRAAARDRGASLRESTRVRGPLAVGEPIELVGADGSVELVDTERIVIATGRRPASDLVALETIARGPQTAALSLTAGCPQAARLALVEAVRSGWWWWIGNGADGGTATLLCDVDELTAIGTRRMLERARSEARGPARSLDTPQLTHATRTTARCSRTRAAVMLLGDAAATIDPLASQGVEKALLAAEHAAAAVRAARIQPGWWPRLCAAHAEWERGLYVAHERTTAEFLRRERRFPNARFWLTRNQVAMPTAARDVRLSPAPGVGAAAVLERFGEGFREVEGAVHAVTGEARAAIGRVPVTALLRLFAAPQTLADAVAAAGSDPRLFVLGPQAVQAAILDLQARGWLSAPIAATETR